MILRILFGTIEPGANIARWVLRPGFYGAFLMVFLSHFFYRNSFERRFETLSFWLVIDWKDFIFFFSKEIWIGLLRLEKGDYHKEILYHFCFSNLSNES